jgi:hypothetical protein
MRVPCSVCDVISFAAVGIHVQSVMWVSENEDLKSGKKKKKVGNPVGGGSASNQYWS